MKRALVLLIVPLIFCAAHADRVGQGAGESENNIAFAYAYLDKYLQLCLATQGCLAAGDETLAVQEILADMPKEYAKPGQIGFKSQTTDKIFNVDRIAMTWPDVGDPIYFNLDELYSTDASGKVRGISIQQAVGYLVHEMGHHHNRNDHIWLDALGHKVSRLLDGRVFANMMSPDYPYIQGLSIFFDETSGGLQSTQVLVTDGVALYDVGADLMKLFKCPLLNGHSSTLMGLALWGFTWENYAGLDPVLVGYARGNCQLNSGAHTRWMAKGFGLRVKTRLVRQPNNSLQFDPRGFVVYQATCSDDPYLCTRAIAEPRFTPRFVKTNLETNTFINEADGFKFQEDLR